jgi:hypothetical protein
VYQKRSEDRFIVFDARTVPQPASTDWSSERRERYLVRPDVATVLSVDPGVWPRTRLQAGASGHRWVGISEGFSRDLPDLQRRIPDGQKLIAKVVALSVPTGAADDLGIWDIDVAQYEMPSASWTLLGYDVAEAGFLSGLSNCGYRPDEAISIRERFAADLNDFHLFAAQAVAEEFRSVTDRRVPEHAPFYVFGLYAVND